MCGPGRLLKGHHVGRIPVCAGTSLKRLPQRKPSFSKPQGKGMGSSSGPSQGGSVGRGFYSSGRKGGFHREVSVRSEAEIHGVTRVQRNSPRELLFLGMWLWKLEGRTLAESQSRVSWVVKGHTCSGAGAANHAGAWEGVSPPWD